MLAVDVTVIATWCQRWDLSTHLALKCLFTLPLSITALSAKVPWTWAAVKSRDITLRPRPHATQKGEGVPGLCATLAPQTRRVWRTGKRACSALTARAHCAQTSRSQLERPPRPLWGLAGGRQRPVGVGGG